MVQPCFAITAALVWHWCAPGKHTTIDETGAVTLASHVYSLSKKNKIETTKGRLLWWYILKKKKCYTRISSANACTTCALLTNVRTWTGQLGSLEQVSQLEVACPFKNERRKSQEYLLYSPFFSLGAQPVFCTCSVWKLLPLALEIEQRARGRWTDGQRLPVSILPISIYFPTVVVVYFKMYDD